MLERPKLASRQTKDSSITKSSETGQQRRRRSSSIKQSPIKPDLGSPPIFDFGATSGLIGRGSSILPVIHGTPSSSPRMSLSRSPSPRAEGGWASPGLSSDFGSTGGTFSPRKAYLDLSVNGGASGSGTVTWANARAKTDEVNGYPSFSTRKTGFFSRHARRISSSLPQFNLGLKKDYSEREKLGRGRPYPYSGSWSDRMRTFIGSMGRRMRMRGLLVMVLILSIILFYTTRMYCKHDYCCTNVIQHSTIGIVALSF